MYYRDGGCVVGVVNDWDRATALSASAPPNTDRTGTIPFMALELLSNSKMVHLYRHDAESFIWLFLWVCGCSTGSKDKALVAPYKVWKNLGMETCGEKKGLFLSGVNLTDINVSKHHAPNSLFCLFLARLLDQLRKYAWGSVRTNPDPTAQDEKDTAIFENLVIKFIEVRAKLQHQFSPQDWFDRERNAEVEKYIFTEVAQILLTTL